VPFVATVLPDRAFHRTIIHGPTPVKTEPRPFLRKLAVFIIIINFDPPQGTMPRILMYCRSE
ncbi:MAG: hypothetical protein K2Q10_01815, partial [Rhodospirillales bacterium]|nr:hypothetical protein [Rhodospirillales bacterium]